jgi:cytosine/adenosine deaminase-related metal-dependent hydrolase
MTSTLIKNAMIALFDRERTFIERGWIFIQNDRIRQIGYDNQNQPEADFVYDLEHHLVMRDLSIFMRIFSNISEDCMS